MKFSQAKGKRKDIGQKSQTSSKCNLSTSLSTGLPSPYFYANQEGRATTAIEEKEAQIKFNTWAATIIDLLA